MAIGVIDGLVFKESMLTSEHMTFSDSSMKSGAFVHVTL